MNGIIGILYRVVHNAVKPLIFTSSKYPIWCANTSVKCPIILKIIIDNIERYKIKAKVRIADDSARVFIGGKDVPELEVSSIGSTDWVDVTSYFKTGENLVQFLAIDLCSEERAFDLDWRIEERPKCEVEGAPRDPIDKQCSADQARDHDISPITELGAVNDWWCTHNEHDGCRYVKSGLQQVNINTKNPVFWEPESCDDDPSGTSSILWMEKEIYVDDLENYKVIEVSALVADYAELFVNGKKVEGFFFEKDKYSPRVSIKEYLHKGWNHIMAKATDECSSDARGQRYFDLQWTVVLDVNLGECPENMWQRAWYTYPRKDFLGRGPNESPLEFDNSWDITIAHSRADNIQFESCRNLHILPGQEGTYTFTLGSDDGARLYIDDTLLIDRWSNQGQYSLSQAEMKLDTGWYKLRIDYYDKQGPARVSFDLERTADLEGNLRGDLDKDGDVDNDDMELFLSEPYTEGSDLIEDGIINGFDYWELRRLIEEFGKRAG